MKKPEKKLKPARKPARKVRKFVCEVDAYDATQIWEWLSSGDRLIEVTGLPTFKLKFSDDRSPILPEVK